MMADGSEREIAARAIDTLGQIGLWHFSPYLMNRIMGRYNADLLVSLKERDLTTVKMRTMAVLAVVPGLTINELSVYAVTELSTMSRTLEALETAGLVRRVERQSDGRVREIYLPDAGRALFEEVWPLLHAGYEKIFAEIEDDERTKFVETMQKILNNVRKHEF